MTSSIKTQQKVPLFIPTISSYLQIELNTAMKHPPVVDHHFLGLCTHLCWLGRKCTTLKRLFWALKCTTFLGNISKLLHAFSCTITCALIFLDLVGRPPGDTSFITNLNEEHIARVWAYLDYCGIYYMTRINIYCIKLSATWKSKLDIRTFLLGIIW